MKYPTSAEDIHIYKISIQKIVDGAMGLWEALDELEQTFFSAHDPQLCSKCFGQLEKMRHGEKSPICQKCQKKRQAELNREKRKLSKELKI